MARSRDFKTLMEHGPRAASHLCVGIDPQLEKIPQVVHARAGTSDPGEVLYTFGTGIIGRTGTAVAAFKPNYAFFLAHGPAGLEALKGLIAFAHSEHPYIPVILDCKVADIGATNEAYAKAFFDVLGADAITVHPYLGSEAMKPFLERTDKGIYVLCRTSNPGAGEFQDLSVTEYGAQGREGVIKFPGLEDHLFLEVARKVRDKWNGNSNCGLVTGATFPSELAAIRDACPTIPLLVPGIGKQGGDLKAAVEAAMDSNGHGFLINVSSAICHASTGDDFVEAADAAAVQYIKDIEDIREAKAGVVREET